MKSLRNDAEKSPITNIAIIILLAIGLISLPIKDIVTLFGLKYTLTNELIFNLVFRALYIVGMIYLIFTYEFSKVFRAPKNIWIILPAFIVAINNLPIVSLITGDARITETALNIVLFVAYALSVAAFEELSFRALVLPMCVLGLKNKKHGAFWAIVISSALFGLAHLMNLFGGASVGGVALQIGYSFLIGAMCAISLIKTKSIYIPIILHGVYNFCGQIIEYLGEGSIWNTAEIILTAVVGVIVGVYMLVLALKIKPSEAQDIV